MNQVAKRIGDATATVKSAQNSGLVTAYYGRKETVLSIVVAPTDPTPADFR